MRRRCPGTDRPARETPPATVIAHTPPVLALRGFVLRRSFPCSLCDRSGFRQIKAVRIEPRRHGDTEERTLAEESCLKKRCPCTFHLRASVPPCLPGSTSSSPPYVGFPAS